MLGLKLIQLCIRGLVWEQIPGQMESTYENYYLKNLFMSAKWQPLLPLCWRSPTKFPDFVSYWKLKDFQWKNHCVCVIKKESMKLISNFIWHQSHITLCIVFIDKETVSCYYRPVCIYRLENIKFLSRFHFNILFDDEGDCIVQHEQNMFWHCF